LLDDRLDIIATDHAPHTWEEKHETYEKAHAGIPLVQHSLLLMLKYYELGKIPLEAIAHKMSHAVADCFRIRDRGYIREGYYADLVIVDFQESTRVEKENVLSKCGWSPFEGQSFPATITHTFVNGNLVYSNNGEGTRASMWNEAVKGSRLRFDRSN
jgi:dihydroorotase